MKFFLLTAVVLSTFCVQAAKAQKIDTKEACRYVINPQAPAKPLFLVTLEAIAVDGVAFVAGANIPPNTKGASGTDLFLLLRKDCLHM